MQFTVFDDYGNEGGGAYKYIYVDFSKLHFHLLGENFKFTKEDEHKKYIKVDTLYTDKLIENAYSFEKLQSKYSYKELMSKCTCN